MNEPNTENQFAQEIMVTADMFDACTRCNRSLKIGFAVLPGDPSLSFTGQFCPKCGRYYVTGGRDIENQLATRYYKHRYRSRDTNLWVYAKEEIIEEETNNKYQYHLNKTAGAKLLLILRDADGKDHEVFLVTDRTFENKSRNIIYCWSRTALILLTFAYYPYKKGKTFKVRGKECRIARIYESDDYRTHSIKTPAAIYLRKNGGYRDPAHPNYPLVIAMVYSPFSKHYEGMTVTYDTDENVYYVDSTKFREFINKHGNPGVHLGFYQKRGNYGFDWLDLKDSSFLMDYGYNVSTKDNLSTATRHDMLSEIVDLKIASVSDLVNHLNFCIASHPKDPGAIACWQNDKEFISNYKVNPDRFMIAGAIAREKK